MYYVCTRYHWWKWSLRPKKLGDSKELDMQTAWGKPSDKILELNTSNKTTYFYQDMEGDII